MKMIDCYYIRGEGKNSKCTKIHGVGIGYNLCKTLVYCKVIGAVSTTLAVPPLAICLGLGVGQGFVNAGIEFVKNGGMA